METLAIRNDQTGIIKMGNAITSKELCFTPFFHSYLVDNKPMKEVWSSLISKLDEQIAKVEINKDGRLKQLYRKRQLLEMAMGRCR